jgi:hypothetical protein
MSQWSYAPVAIAGSTIRTTPITGFVSAPGIVADTDSIVAAFGKVDGNIGAIGAVTAASNHLCGFSESGSVNDTEFTMTWPAFVLTLAPTGANFKVYVAGTEYTRTGAATDTVDLTTLSEGQWIAYYGPEYAATSPWAVTDATVRLRLVQGTRLTNPKLIKEYAIVSQSYWDDTSNTTLPAEERHGVTMDGDTHYQQHWTQGTRLRNTDGTLSGFTIYASGVANDTHMQFGWDACDVIDEDITSAISASTIAVTNSPMIYWNGALPRWHTVAAAAWCSVGTRPSYNDAGTQAEMTTDYYSYSFVVHTSIVNTPIVLVQGRTQAATLTEAINNASIEVYDIRRDLTHTIMEFVIGGVIFFQAKNAYANSYKAVIVKPTSITNYLDFRYININRTEVKALPVATIDDAIQLWDDADGIWVASSANFDDLVNDVITTEKGAVSGVAPLDASQLLPLTNLPDHASTHEPGGGDEIAYGTPVTLLPDQTNDTGAQPEYSLSDHIHNVPAGTPTYVRNASAKGSGTSFALNDHHHSLCSTAAAADQVAQFNGTVWTPVNPEDAWTPSTACVLFDDFVAASASGFGLNWTNTVSGGSSTVANGNGLSGRPGIATLTAGNASGRNADMRLDTSGFIIGGGQISIEASINIPNLSVAGTAYILRFGLGDVVGTDPNNGIYFEYDHSNSLNWRIRTANGNLNRTTTTTATAVAAGAYLKLKIVINAAGTLATFYVNGVSVGTIGTNLPTAVSTPFLNIRSGTTGTARSVSIDYFSLVQRFTAAR